MSLLPAAISSSHALFAPQSTPRDGGVGGGEGGGVAHHLQERGEGPHCLNCTPISCAIYVNTRKLKHIISPKFTPIGNTVWESGGLHVTHTVYITHNRIAHCNAGVCVLCMCHVLACVYLVTMLPM